MRSWADSRARARRAGDDALRGVGWLTRLPAALCRRRHMAGVRVAYSLRFLYFSPRGGVPLGAWLAFYTTGRSGSSRRQPFHPHRLEPARRREEVVRRSGRRERLRPPQSCLTRGCTLIRDRRRHALDPARYACGAGSAQGSAGPFWRLRSGPRIGVSLVSAALSAAATAVRLLARSPREKRSILCEGSLADRPAPRVCVASSPAAGGRPVGGLATLVGVGSGPRRCGLRHRSACRVRSAVDWSPFRHAPLPVRLLAGGCEEIRAVLPVINSRANRGLC